MTSREANTQVHLVTKEQHGLRIDQCVPQGFASLSRRKARQLIGEGCVWINGRVIRVHSRKVSAGDRITVKLEDANPNDLDVMEAESSENANHFAEDIDWDVHGGRPSFLFRDKYIAILDKPSGIPTEPTRREDLRTCLRQVEAIQREEGLHPHRQYVAAAHRLDAQASGVLAFALRKKAAAELSSQFAVRTAKRVYRALVVGNVEKDEDELHHHLTRVGPGVRQGVVSADRGKHAITNYQVLERFGAVTLVELQLQTGRTHQIRVQMAEVGHPLVGDWLYLPKEREHECPKGDRVMLHAVSLSLVHPRTQKIMEFVSELPADFIAYMEQLRNQSQTDGDE